MYLRTLLVVIVIGILVIFALVNWGAFTAQTTLSVGFATVEAPLGLVLLGFAGLLTLLFLIYVVYLQSSVLLESRRYARELQSQRELADQAEASRVAELRSLVTSEVQKLASEAKEMKTSLLARLEQLETDLRSSIEQSGNALAAYLAEIDDRLEKAKMGKLPNATE
jgi:uncharacterized integral membrane protein